MAENTQSYQVIGIEGDALHCAAYTADGVLYDQVRLRKPGEDVKSITPKRRWSRC